MPEVNIHTDTLPVLPLRDVVVFPHMVLPLFVGRHYSIAALEEAMDKNIPIFLLAQKTPNQENPKIEDLYEIGTIATVLQMLKLPDGTVKVLVEGKHRAYVKDLQDNGKFFEAVYVEAEEKDSDDKTVEGMRRALINQFEELVKLNKKVPSEVLNNIVNIEENGRLADTIAAHLQLKLEQRQDILSLLDIKKRVTFLLEQIEAEIDILQVEKRIRGRVKRQMEKSQRDYYLSEQVKAIQKELGDGEDSNELDELEQKINTAGFSQEAKEKALSELKKLRMMSPMSAEATVVRSYIDTLLGLPWKKKSKINKDTKKAEEILNHDHFGLEKVKERILEFLSVQKRVDKLKGPILCLVGPPGVGKTSLGQSIARATGREYVRMALGGVRDESEIRGHRRTYIGSMPGKILQNMTKVGVKNPLFLLDEIDKMAQDFRGDPASALLEVLDPEQNNSFVDHYAEVEFDLSDVMFIATANTLNIPPALRDRMEIINLSGYVENEKVNIAENYLVPKQIKANGIHEGEATIEESALLDIIRYYTRESGVRSLEREIARIFRKVVMKNSMMEKEKAVSSGRKKKVIEIGDPIVINNKNLNEFLGVRRFDFGMAASEDRVGQVTGLAWTEVGGELLTIEAVALKGKGQIIRTGQLGDVMQESITAALSVVRARYENFGLAEDFYEKQDIHVHVPEGATPKDGPSAGIAMTVAITSALTKIPVYADVAMTGEVTLRGEVLPIGGLKEKLLAAQRGGIKRVLIPQGNVKDLEEIPENIKEHLDIHPVKWIDEVLKLSLEYIPDVKISVSMPLPKGKKRIQGESIAKH